MRVAHEAARASHLSNLSLRWGSAVEWDAARNKPRRVSGAPLPLAPRGNGGPA
jgi:hypothetical protein